MRLSLICLIIFCYFSTALLAQPTGSNVALANQYINNGEYEKAASIYDALSKESPNIEAYFSSYLRCLKELGEYKRMEESLKKRLKQFPRDVYLYVELGGVYEKLENHKEADKHYQKGIDMLPNDRYSIYRFAQSLQNAGKYEWAAKTFEEGSKILKNKEEFSYDLGTLYLQQGTIDKMVLNYLMSIRNMPQRMPSVQSVLMRQADDSTWTMVHTKLLEYVVSEPENLVWPEMLAWYYIQHKDYKNAFRQVTALDRKLNENGSRVYRIALQAENEKDYEAAIIGYKYIIDKKGENSPYYIDALKESLICKQNQITETLSQTPEQIAEIEKDYEALIQRVGKTRYTLPIIMNYASFHAFYNHNLNKAIELLEEAKSLPLNENNNQDAELLAQLKLDLGDYYLMNNDLWESMLLYGQVDKAQKDSPFGEYARYKNAKLAYYRGDFEWAQGQLDALKASTSELISNDAIELSVFIMEHLGLDSIPDAMERFATIDLLVFQNKLDEAFKNIDTLLTKYPKHEINDDVLLLKSDIFVKKKDYPTALNLLETIEKEYKNGILVDNSLYKQAQIYQNQLKDKVKALVLYERIITEFPSSIFIIESRKNFRILRGDKLDGVQ